MPRRCRLSYACTAVLAFLPVTALKAEIRNFGMIGGTYMLIEASGPTRSDPEEFTYESGGSTVRGSVFCREDLAIGAITPGTLQNFTVDTATKRISFIQDGEPVSFVAPTVYARDGQSPLFAKGSFVVEESESPDPSVRVVYKTEGDFYFTNTRIGDELRAEMTETTTYYLSNQPVLSCREVFKVAGYMNPPPPPPPDPTMMQEIFGAAVWSSLKAAQLIDSLFDDGSVRIKRVNKGTAMGVRG